MRLFSSKTAAFFAKSFFFSFLSATLLYILVRLFFFEFPFTIAEGFELYGKMLLTILIFIMGCKAVFAGVILLETNLENNYLKPGRYLLLFKKTVLIMLAAMTANTGKTQLLSDDKIKDSNESSNEESARETDNNFLIRLPS